MRVLLFFKDRDKLPQESIQWSDAIILVYSITDRDSFIYAEMMLNRLQKLSDLSSPPVVLVGNKTDLKLGREVSQPKFLDYAIK
jgi:Ras-related and estrogen-regulated growth inhibitor-like protein